MFNQEFMELSVDHQKFQVNHCWTEVTPALALNLLSL